MTHKFDTSPTAIKYYFDDQVPCYIKILSEIPNNVHVEVFQTMQVPLTIWDDKPAYRFTLDYYLRDKLACGLKLSAILTKHKVKHSIVTSHIGSLEKPKTFTPAQFIELMSDMNTVSRADVTSVNYRGYTLESPMNKSLYIHLMYSTKPAFTAALNTMLDAVSNNEIAHMNGVCRFKNANERKMITINRSNPLVTI